MTHVVMSVKTGVIGAGDSGDETPITCVSGIVWPGDVSPGPNFLVLEMDHQEDILVSDLSLFTRSEYF